MGSSTSVIKAVSPVEKGSVFGTPDSSVGFVVVVNEPVPAFMLIPGLVV